MQQEQSANITEEAPMIEAVGLSKFYGDFDL